MDNKYLESMEELGLQSGFTLEELKKKWRELSKKYHSDKHAQADEVLRELADEKMKKINEAYSYLEKNFVQNQNTRSNSSNSYHTRNQNYEEEYYYEDYGYRREDYYFLSEEEELDYFGEFLSKLKREIERTIRQEIQIFIDELNRIESSHKRYLYSSSDLNEFVLEIDDIATKIINELEIIVSVNIFFNNIKKINKLKISDLYYLNHMSRNEIIKIDKFIKNNSDEINSILFNKNFKDLNYINILKSRYYYFMEERAYQLKETLYPIVRIREKLNQEINEIKQIPIIGDVLAYINAEKFVYQYLQDLKRFLQNMYNTFPDKIFKTMKRVIYIGIEDYENEAFFSEAYYKSHTDPAYGVIFYGKDIEGLKILLSNFPNETNNVLVKLYTFYKQGKIEEIKKLSTEITKIEYNNYFINIVDTLFTEFTGKEKSFFMNIQLLFSEQNKKNMLLLLKNVSKKLEENINTNFWGKNKENDDFKELIQKYYFLNKEENIRFLNESFPYVEDLLKYYVELQEILKENKKIEDLIEVYAYVEDLKKDEKTFEIYFSDEIEDEKERKKRSTEIDLFYWKNLDKLKNIKIKFSKYKDINLEKSELIKKFIDKIKNKVEEIKLLISSRIEKYESKLSSLETDKEKKKKEKSQINMYKNIIRFFKELENF